MIRQQKHTFSDLSTETHIQSSTPETPTRTVTFLNIHRQLDKQMVQVCVTDCDPYLPRIRNLHIRCYVVGEKIVYKKLASCHILYPSWQTEREKKGKTQYSNREENTAAFLSKDDDSRITNKWYASIKVWHSDHNLVKMRYDPEDFFFTNIMIRSCQ